MTFQKHRYPKFRISLRLKNENYDFLYQLAKQRDVSIAKVLNDVISEHQSGITICKTYPERVTVN